MKRHETKRHETKLPEPAIRRRAWLIGAFLLLLLGISIAACLWAARNASQSTHPTAYVYSNGILLRTIDLSAVRETYRFTVSSADGKENVIEVRPGSIGILSADCPDKLCVHQGFLSAPLFPIVCLPNQLVIEVKEGEEMPDAIVY